MPKLPAPADEAAELVDLMMNLMRSFHRHSAGDTLAVMNEAGLTMGQMVALFILANAGEQTMGVLAQKVQLSPAAATHMIDQLVRAGLVDRLDVPEDRRAKRIAITAEGRALIRRLDTERRRDAAEVVAHLKPQTAQRLTQALRLAIQDLTSSEPAKHGASRSASLLRTRGTS
jgi:DNA-binding MarR family transcriptional regulator